MLRRHELNADLSVFNQGIKRYQLKNQAGFLEINMFKGAHASEDMSTELLEAKAIQSANKKIKADKIEASGLLWLPTEKLYLLISDEHYKKKQPGIYFYNDGLILDNVSVADKSKLLIDDLESISSDGDFIYILSSLSHNSNDKLKAKRKKLIRFKLQDQQIGKWQEVDLYQVLNALKDWATVPGLSRFLQQAIANHSMDIESHFVVNNALYLGFKAPFLDGAKTSIIKIDGVNEMFDGAQPVAEIWQAISLIDPENGKPMQLSDMIWISEQLFLLSVSTESEHQRSVLWCYRDHDNSLKPRQIFTGLKAEGLAYRPEQSLFTVVFDQGSKTASKYISLPLSAVNCQ